MAHGAEHLAAKFCHESAGILLQGVTKGIIGGNKEPALATARNDGLCGNLTRGVCVINVVDAVRSAGLVGQFSAACTGVHGDPFLVPRQFLHRQGAARVQQAGNHIHLLIVNPLAGLGGGDIGLVLMVGADNLNRLTQHLPAKILDRHLHSHLGAFSSERGVDPRHVGKYPDFNYAV